MKKIVLGMIGIACLFLLVGCDKEETKTVNNEKEDNGKIVQEEVKKVEEEQAKSLMEKIRMPLWSNYYEVYYVENLEAKNLPNDAKLLLGSSSYRTKNENASKMTQEEMKKEIVDIFGENVEYKDESIQAGACYGDSMNYQNGTYTFDGGCGGMGPVDSYRTKIVDAYETDDSIVITEAIAYLSFEDWTPYEDNYTRIISQKRDGKELGRESSAKEFNIEEYIDELEQYTYTFKKENDHYVFLKVKEK